MDKQATDFALMAGAFSKDEKMARQVCRLLADGDVNEAMARKLLKLVSDGKLASEVRHYPWYVWNGTSYTIPWNTTSGSTPSVVAMKPDTAYSLTTLAKENAA